MSIPRGISYHTQGSGNAADLILEACILFSIMELSYKKKTVHLSSIITECISINSFFKKILFGLTIQI